MDGSFIEILFLAQFQISDRTGTGKAFYGMENTFRYLYWVFFFHKITPVKSGAQKSAEYHSVVIVAQFGKKSK